MVPRLVEQAAPTREVLQVNGLTHLLQHRVGEGLLGRHEHLERSVNKCGVCVGEGLRLGNNQLLFLKYNCGCMIEVEVWV